MTPRAHGHHGEIRRDVAAFGPRGGRPVQRRRSAVFRTYSARAFDRDTAGAKRGAGDGPIHVTDRGRPSHVRLSIAEYERLVAGAAAVGDRAIGSATRPPTPLDLLGSDPAAADVDLPLERFDDVPAPVDLDEFLD